MKKTTVHDTKIVEWSDEDICYIGRCPEHFLGGVHGEDQTKVYKELCEVVTEHLASIKKAPTPEFTKGFSGKFVIRMEPSQHKAVALRAKVAGESLNTYAIKKLVSA